MVVKQLYTMFSRHNSMNINARIMQNFVNENLVNKNYFQINPLAMFASV